MKQITVELLTEVLTSLFLVWNLYEYNKQNRNINKQQVESEKFRLIERYRNMVNSISGGFNRTIN